MKKLLVCILLYLILINKSQAQKISFNIFEGNLNKALSYANNNNKKVLLYFTAKWCAPCIQMQKEVFPEEEVTKFVNTHFIFLKVNIDSTEDKIAKDKFFSGTVPGFCILDNLGNKQFAFYGYKSPGDLLRLLKDGLAPEQTALFQYKRKFLKGDKSIDFLKKYIDTLEAYNDPMADSVYSVLISIADSTEMSNEYIIHKMLHYTKEKTALDYIFVLNNRTFLSKKYGAKPIDAILMRPWDIELQNAAINANIKTFTKLSRDIDSLKFDKNIINEMLYEGEKTLWIKAKNYREFVSLIESDKYSSIFNSDKNKRLEDGAITILYSDTNNTNMLNIAKKWIQINLQQDITSKKLSIAGQIEEKLGNKNQAFMFYNQSIEHYLKENPFSDIPPGLQSLIDNLNIK